MKRRQAIWATSQCWRSPFQVSAHHYSRILVEWGWDVAFLSHPISPLHFLRRASRHAARERWRSWRRGGETDLDGHLTYYTPFTLCPPHNTSWLRRRSVLDLWPHLTVPNLKGYVRSRGFDDVELVVIDSPLHGFWLDCFPNSRKILRIVDNLGGFQRAAPSWIERQNELIPRADHVIVTSKVLEKESAAHQPKALTYVPNGVQIEHFLGPTPALPEEFQSIPPPRALYVGSLEEWLDVDLLEETARQLPKVSFVLIGEGSADLGRLRLLANVHLLGRRPYRQVPAYLRHAAVGIIPFKNNLLTQAINPVKLYEYLASGLPVVATASDELEHLNSPAALCHNAPEFRDALQSALDNPPKTEALIRFARQADWQERAKLMFARIGIG